MQGDGPQLHEISVKPLQICCLLKADDADDEISIPFHPTHVKHFRPGENDFQQWAALIETCEFFIWDGTDISLSVLDGDSPKTWGVGLQTGSSGSNGVLPATSYDQCWHWLHITQLQDMTQAVWGRLGKCVTLV